MRIAPLIQCSLLLSLAVTQAQATEAPASFQIVGPSPAIHMDIYALGPRYVSTIYAIGPYRGADPSQPFVQQASDILRRIARQRLGAIVFNGGYSEDNLYSPAGLLMIRGNITHPFSFEKKGPNYRLSAVVCLDTHNQLKFMTTASFDRDGASIQASCASALQAGPYILQAGANVIRNTLKTSQATAIRTILGKDRAGHLYLVSFKDPVDLFTAGEALRPGSRLRVQPVATGQGRAPTTSVSLSDAINLDGDMNALVVRDGIVAIGDPTRPIPSAIAVRTY